ncbi:porin [Rhizobium rhizogenes]|uniref:porin n=1 Tax=Rhizobium rhizogenes TaxID=359 RepID=UPI0022B5E551|nr:porin [Rhizobium rhizogenes]MCZ7448281.1 porin [Rhizobium rhizogenes]MCZ7465714.1 porin [Rhizobium rhizogenes]
MKIRHLLLSSAALLAAASVTHAADAVVAAQPEPLEYVRICDAYGAGYFYIPGTETCLKIGGYVRSEGFWYNGYNPTATLGTKWHTRAHLQVDTASDTEYGPLKTETILRWDWNDGGTTSTNLLWSYISLGGFTVGKKDSAYNLYTGYAGDVINDDVIYDGPYELNQITYNYDAGNGFTAVVSLEDSNSGSDSSSFGGAWVKAKADHYAPNVVAGAGYKAGAWQFRVVGGYDSIVEEGAVKARIDADFGVFSAFLMGGYNTDGKKLNQYAGSNLDASACPTGRGDLCGWGDWAVWGGVGVPINNKLKFNLQLAYTDSKIFAATTNVKWYPVKDLLIEPAVSYTSWDSVKQDQWAGILRFQRSF